MIIRGTTPTHVFHIPFSIAHVVEVYITYTQDNRVVVDKRLDDLKIDIHNNTLSLQLTQDNTLGFCFNNKYRDNIVLIEVKLLFDNNIICTSRPIRDKVVNQLRDGKIYADSAATPLGETVVYDGGEIE